VEEAHGRLPSDNRSGIREIVTSDLMQEAWLK
jgi:hypothetical protein